MYHYIKIIHEGEDYVTVKVDRHEETDITYPAAGIIKTLLNKIHSMERKG